MKIALFLSIACAALAISGCSTERGGSADTYDTSNATMEQTGPGVLDPSLPEYPDLGPQSPPP